MDLRNIYRKVRSGKWEDGKKPREGTRGIISFSKFEIDFLSVCGNQIKKYKYGQIGMY